MSEKEKLGQKFERLVSILDTLRGDKGCPWDKQQDEKSIINYFLEEVYEAVDALYREDCSSLAEELGDVMMEIVFLARIFKEKGEFDLGHVLENINRKMIRRHPHVFGSQQVEDYKEIVNTWNKQKKREKQRDYFSEGINKNAPALLVAFQIGVLASSSGFDWKESSEVLEKVKEEISELEKAIQEGEQEKIFIEIGDILFSLVNLSRHLGINSELALRKTNQKFMRRFKYVEKKLKEEGKTITESNLEEMDKIWEEAKQRLK